MLARRDVKWTVAVINRASVAVRVELNGTASIRANGDPNESCIRLSIASAEAVAVTILDLTALRLAGKVGQAVERAWSVPAVALNGEGTTVAGVVARRVVVWVGLVVDGFARVVDDGEAGVAAVCVAACGTGDG